MTARDVTGNHAAGYALVAAGEANRVARGCCGGVYPDHATDRDHRVPHGAPFSQGQLRAGGVRAQRHGRLHRRLDGRCPRLHRQFLQRTLYMTENVFAAGLLPAAHRDGRLQPDHRPAVEHLGRSGRQPRPAGCALAAVLLRLAPGPGDTILLAFRVAEDHRVLCPAMVTQDGFLLSHTQMVVDLPEQDLVGRATCRRSTCRIGSTDHPRTYGGMTWPRDTQRQRGHPGGHGQGARGDARDALDEFERRLRPPAGRGLRGGAHGRRRRGARRLQHAGRAPPERSSRRGGRPARKSA